MKIGFIGLGNMGRHMARHLILAEEMSPVRLYETLAGKQFRLPAPTFSAA